MSANSDAVLLTDEQIQQFICDGYIALESDVDPAVHQLIDERLQYVKENEFHMGNNFMPRIPEFHLVTDCPVVRGALISILGADYMLYSHRCIHWRDPEKEPVSDELFNERVRGDSHQDSYPPFLNWRSHPHQFVRMMYYPHDTELVNGPTHVVPGSHYHGGVSEEDRHNEIPITGKAGTVFLSHFDIIHSGSPNQSDRVRNMMKFIFARGRRADHPSWDHVDATWKNLNTKAPYRLDNCWQFQWNKLCGTKVETENKGEVLVPLTVLADEMDIEKRLEIIQNLGHTASANAVPTLVSLLNEAHQAERTAAIYALAEIGAPAIEALVTDLVSRDKASPDLQLRHETFRSCDACHALSAIGEASIDAVLPLMDSAIDRTIISAVHILNDIGIDRPDVRAALEKTMFHESPRIAAVSANALGGIGAKCSVGSLIKVLDHSWDMETLNEMDWPMDWAVHFAAAHALSRIGDGLEHIEADMIRHLKHRFGGVGDCLTHALRKLGTQSALIALIDDLSYRRWDPEINKEQHY